MLEIVFMDLNFDRANQQWNEDHLATFYMEGTHLYFIAGDSRRFHLRDAQFIDSRGAIVTIADGERWGKMLPRMFASSRVDVQVTEIVTPMA